MTRSARMALMALFLPVASCVSAPMDQGIVVTDAWARPGASEGDTTGMFFRVENRTEAEDRLLGAETLVAASVEIHQTMIEGDVVHMEPVSEVEIPAGGSVAFEPGGLHAMLVGLTEPLEVGERFTATLRFERAGAIRLEVEVRAP